MKTTCFAIGTLLLIASVAWSGEAVTIQFSSIRSSSATIDTDGDFYTISVTLRPVGCFDVALNRSISFRKAENLALMGLAEYLIPEKTDRRTISCSGLEVMYRTYASEVCEMTCRIPRKGVKIVKKSEVRKNVTSRVPIQLKGGLLTREADYRETLDILRHDLESAIPPAVTSPEQLEEFFFALSDAEEKIVGALDQMKSQLKGDLELLSMERDPLLATLETVRKELVTRLEDRVASAEWLETCTEIELSSDFATAIVSQPFLLQQGGCRIFEHEGKWYILAVADAVVDSGLKPSVGRMKARKIAKVRSQAELAAQKEGVFVQACEILEEKNSVENRNGMETVTDSSDYSRTIETRVSAIIRNVRQVGWWLISDETSGECTIYVALGVRVED